MKSPNSTGDLVYPPALLTSQSVPPENIKLILASQITGESQIA